MCGSSYQYVVGKKIFFCTSSVFIDPVLSVYGATRSEGDRTTLDIECVDLNYSELNVYTLPEWLDSSGVTVGDFGFLSFIGIITREYGQDYTCTVLSIFGEVRMVTFTFIVLCKF